MPQNVSSLSRRDFVKLGAATTGLAALGSLGLPKVTLADDGSKTFTYAIAGEPSVSPNCITTSDRFGLMTLSLVYSHMIYIDPDGTENFYLCESYEWSDDQLVLTVHLRDGVTWNDGEPFTADDVVFTYEAKKTREDSNGYSALVFEEGEVAVEKVDDLTVTFTFPFVSPAGVEAVLAGENFIMPKHIYEGVTDWENNDANSQGVGTGPYKLDEYVVGQYLSFSANESYYDGAPDIDRIVFQIVTNENTGMQAIQAGEVNAWIGTPAQVEQMSIEANGLTVTPYSEGRVAYVCFNCARVTDPKVRQAILYSFDKQAIAEAALLSDEYFDLVYTFLPPSNSFYAGDEVEHYDQDVEKAKSLLAEAGVSNPTYVVGYSSSDSLQMTAAVMMQEQAAAAGITLDIRGVDATALYNDMTSADNTYDMYFGGYIMGVDPSTYSSLFVTDEAYNYMHYTADEMGELDDCFKQGASETDEDARRELYTKAQQLLADSGAFYPLYSNKRLLVTTSNVGGFDEAKLVPVYTFEDASKLTME